MRYLTPDKLPYSPQGKAAAAGSAFDARVKTELSHTLFGKSHSKAFNFIELFESQVEEEFREWAMEIQSYAYAAYKVTGRYDELRDLMLKATTEPRFEVELRGEIEGVPLLGKPDTYFMIGDLHFILDWKCRGFASVHAQSPTKHFKLCRDGYSIGKASRTHGKCHPQYMPMMHKGFEIHAGYLEYQDEAYAAQTTMYGWLLGVPVGSEDAICMIDELCCTPIEGGMPLVRVAELCSRVGTEFQRNLLGQYKALWHAIQTDTVVTPEKFEELCITAKSLATEEDDFFLSMANPTRCW
jgi:hypothetical protein